MRFPENLKKLRAAMGCSQKELAKILKVDRSTVTYWERGQKIPDIETMFALADTLGVTVDELWR